MATSRVKVERWGVGTMAVVRRFRARTSVAALAAALDSVGAHLAAKLQAFGTDERTLTDELCDMFCIWSADPSFQHHLDGALPLNSMALAQMVDVTITKTTQWQEARAGADLALRVTTPLGMKRALFQAKVVEPDTLRLRCHSKAGWLELWSQLVLMRQFNGTSSYLLAYLPANLLKRGSHPFLTWEHSIPKWSPSGLDSAYGATAIPVDSLLRPDGKWRFRPPVAFGGSHRRTSGLTMARLLIDLLSCGQGGTWAPAANVTPLGDWSGAQLDGAPPVPYRAACEVSLIVRGLTRAEWERLESDLRELPPTLWSP